MHLVFKFTPEIDAQATLKLKVEINTREHASLLGFDAIRSPWKRLVPRNDADRLFEPRNCSARSSRTAAAAQEP